MKYGEIELKVLVGSLSIAKGKEQEVRHYPGTDKASAVELGRIPTRITCTIKAESPEERILVESLLHRKQENRLEFGDFFYKKVVTGESGEFEPVSAKKQVWFADAEFICLNPIPYDTDSEERLY